MLNEKEIKIIIQDTSEETKKECCNRCDKDITDLFITLNDNGVEDKVEYDSKKDLLVCEKCYQSEIVFSTTQNQRRISNPQERAYIIYDSKNINLSSENVLGHLSLSSGSHPSAIARKKEREQAKEIKELKEENKELQSRVDRLEELVQQLLNANLQTHQEQPPK